MYITQPEKVEDRMFFVIYNKRLAGFLLLNGCLLVETSKNRLNQDWLVFKFINNETLKIQKQRYKEIYGKQNK